MQIFQFGFWNHNSFSQLNSRIFGCRSHGISTSSRYYEPGEIGKVLWNKELKGEVLHESLFFGNEVSVLFLSEGDFKVESLNIYNETNPLFF